MAKTRILLPGDLGPPRFFLVAQILNRLTDDHELVENGVASEPLFDLLLGRVCPYRLDRLRNVVEAFMIVALHTGTASRSARSRTRGFRNRSAAASTPIPRISSASCSNPIRSMRVLPGSSSTRRSTSLSGVSSPRATDPKIRRFRAP